MSEVNNTQARRNVNAENARMLAECGLVVFPSSGKVPLVKAFNRLDTDLRDDEREEHAAKYRQEHDGEEPPHIGATRTLSVVKMLWRKYPDAVPSIACGPSGLVVLDADAKDGGPEKLGQLLEECGYPKGAPKVPTRDGGFHLYLRSDGTFGNRAGALKRDYGTDVRGRGGQTVAPGSWREDGKRYGTRKDLFALLRAHRNGTIPKVPDYIRAKIGEAPEGEATLSESDPTIKSLIQQLGAEAWPEFSSVFDETLGKYSLEYLRDCEAGFVKLYDDPSSDRSANRFNAACYLAGAFPDLTVHDYAAFCSEWDGAGDFDERQLAREYAKARLTPRLVYKPSDGAAFGDVSDQVADDVSASRDTTAKSLPFEFESDVAANAQLPDWLVEGIIEASTLCIPYGAPNAGKSLVVLDLLYHVAAGKPWRERDVKEGSVLYLSVEGPNGTARRAKAWREYHGVADGKRLPLAFIRTSVDLFNNGKKAARAIVEAAKRLEAVTGLPCRAIAIDTVSAVTPGMVENASESLSIFIQNLRVIMTELKGAAVLPVHHTGKDESRGLRGSTTLLAAADTTILVSGGQIKTMKMRDGQSGQVFPFAVKVLNLWTDAKGKPVGAPVAIEPERGAALSAVDDENDAPLLPQLDRREDRIRAVVEVFEAEAERQKASDENASAVKRRLELQSGEIWRAVNEHRKAYGLEALGRSTVQAHVSAAVEAGSLEAVGTAARPLYRLG